MAARDKVNCQLLLSDEGTAELKSKFDVFAEDGVVPVHNFANLLRTVALELEGDELERATSSADPDGTGSIKFEDFQNVVVGNVTAAPDADQLFKAFKALKNQENQVTVAELRHHLLSFSAHTTEDNVDDFFVGAPMEKDGVLDFKKYKDILCFTGLN